MSELMPVHAGEAPLLAVDAVTGLYWRGEHQLTLASVLDSMRKEIGDDIDPRFLTSDDAELGWSTTLPSESPSIQLRPMMVRDADGPCYIRKLVVHSAVYLTGLDEVVRREPVMIPDLMPVTGDEYGRMMSPDDWTEGGLLRRAVERETAGDPDGVVVAGMGTWLAHGMLAEPIGNEALGVVNAARDAADSPFVGGQAFCAIANRAQTLADSLVDELIRSRTNGLRWRRDLENQIAIENSAPFPDLHRAEAVCWRMRSLMEAVVDPTRSFDSRNVMAAAIAMAAIQGDADAAKVLDAWLDRAHVESPPELDTGQVINWEKAVEREADEVRRRDAALARGEKPPPPKPKLGGIGAMVEDDGESALESVHEGDLGSMLITLNSGRTKVTRALIVLKSPLGEGGSFACAGEPWMPLKGSRGLVWYDPSLASLTSRIGEVSGGRIQIKAIREYGHVPREIAERKSATLERRIAMMAEMAEGYPAEMALRSGLTPMHGLCGTDGEVFVLTEGQVPIASAIVLPALGDMRPGLKMNVKIGTLLAQWTAVKFAGSTALVPDAAEVLGAMRGLRFPLWIAMPSGPFDSIVNLDIYEPDPSAGADT